MKLLKGLSLLLIINVIDQISCIISPLSKKVRKLSDSDYIVSNLYLSEKDNCYYVKFYVGEDKISQTYILDTTFSIFSSPCNLCSSCENHNNPFYIINNEKDIINCNSYQCSNFVNQNYCQDENCYFNIDNNFNNDKNIEGILVSSKIFLNNYNSLSSLSLPIGCTIKEGSFYKNKEINGIIGLNNNKKTFIDNIYNFNIIQNNLFTICLSYKGGYLSFGKIINYSSINSINYIDILPSTYYLFELKINTIRIEEETFSKEYISYIDSTKKYTIFPNEIFNFLIEYFRKKTNNNYFNYDSQYGYCKIFNNNEEEENTLFEIFHNIIINFNGYTFEWKPYNYIIEYKIENNQIRACLGFKESYNDVIILGTNFMVNNDIIFDKKNQKIAFIESDCDQFEIEENIKTDELILNEEQENNIDTDSDTNNEIKWDINSENIEHLTDADNIINTDFELNESILNKESKNDNFSDNLDESINNITSTDGNEEFKNTNDFLTNNIGVDINNSIINYNSNNNDTFNDNINSEIIDITINSLINNSNDNSLNDTHNIIDNVNETLDNEENDNIINESIDNMTNNIINNETLNITESDILNYTLSDSLDILNDTSNYTISDILDILNDTSNYTISDILGILNDTSNYTINDTLDILNDTSNYTINDTLDILNDTSNYTISDILDILNDTSNYTINDTLDILNDTSNYTINDTLDILNDTSNYTVNDTLDILNDSSNYTVNDTLDILNDSFNYSINDSIQIENLSDTFNHSSTIINYENYTTEKIEEEKYFMNHNYSSTSLYSTTINQEFQTEEIITDITNNEKNNSLINESPTNSYINQDNKNKNEVLEKEEEEDKSMISNIFSTLKSFLKNKLIYFLFALLGVILCFVIVVLISCAIISCIKMFKRRNYMRQVDIEVPKDSKYNTASLSSRSN